MQKVSNPLRLFTKAILPLTTFALSALLTTGPAQAQTQQDDPTTTQAQNTVNTPDEAATNKQRHVFITFTKIRPTGVSANAFGASPDLTNLGCSVGYPQVTDTTFPPSASWIGSVSCSANTGLYGTTVLYHPSGGANIAYGTQINSTNTSEGSSSGSYNSLSSGNYAVNFNITITPPAGYTTTPGTNCHLVNNNTSITCTTTTQFTQP